MNFKPMSSGEKPGGSQSNRYELSTKSESIKKETFRYIEAIYTIPFIPKSAPKCT